MPLYMGVDIGTTNIAVVLLDSNSGSLEAVQVRQNNSETTSPEDRKRGLRESDADLTTELAVEAMMQTVRHAKNNIIEGIGVTGQMHGMVLVSKDHRPLSPFIGWQDRRCDDKVQGSDSSYIDRMLELAGEDGFLQEGCCPASGFMGSTLFWLKEKHKLPLGVSKACFMSDYVTMRLTGKEPVTDPTNAGGSGIYNVAKKEWDTDLVCKLGIPEDILPNVLKSGEIIGKLKGEMAEKIGLNNRPIVCVGCGDNQASFAGSVADRDGTVLVNMGTGSQVSVHVKEPLIVKGLETRCDLDGEYLLVGANLCGGNSYALLERFFNEVGRIFFGSKGNEELYGKMNDLAIDVSSGADDLRCEPFFFGTRLHPDRKAVWLGMSASNFTPEHMIRALLEGVARQSKILYRGMLRSRVHERRTLVGSGNGIRKNPLFAAILSRTFGLPLQIPVHPEESAFGAALLASVGCHQFSSIREAGGLIKYE